MNHDFIVFLQKVAQDIAQNHNTFASKCRYSSLRSIIAIAEKKVTSEEAIVKSFSDAIAALFEADPDRILSKIPHGQHMVAAVKYLVESVQLSQKNYGANFLCTTCTLEDIKQLLDFYKRGKLQQFLNELASGADEIASSVIDLTFDSSESRTVQEGSAIAGPAPRDDIAATAITDEELDKIIENSRSLNECNKYQLTFHNTDRAVFLNPSQFARIIDYISNSEILTRIELANCCINDEQLANILKALRKSKSMATNPIEISLMKLEGMPEIGQNSVDILHDLLTAEIKFVALELDANPTFNRSKDVTALLQALLDRYLNGLPELKWVNIPAGLESNLSVEQLITLAKAYNIRMDQGELRPKYTVGSPPSPPPPPVVQLPIAEPVIPESPVICSNIVTQPQEKLNALVRNYVYIYLVCKGYRQTAEYPWPYNDQPWFNEQLRDLYTAAASSEQEPQREEFLQSCIKIIEEQILNSGKTSFLRSFICDVGLAYRQRFVSGLGELPLPEFRELKELSEGYLYRKLDTVYNSLNKMERIHDLCIACMDICMGERESTAFFFDERLEALYQSVTSVPSYDIANVKLCAGIAVDIARDKGISLDELQKAIDNTVVNTVRDFINKHPHVPEMQYSNEVTRRMKTFKNCISEEYSRLSLSSLVSDAAGPSSSSGQPARELSSASFFARIPAREDSAREDLQNKP